MKIKYKLTILLLFIALFAMSLVAIFGYYIASKSIEEDEFKKLVNIRNSKQSEIKRYLNSCENIVKYLAKCESTKEAFHSFNSSFEYLKSSNNRYADLNMLDQRDSVMYLMHCQRMQEFALDTIAYELQLSKNPNAILLQGYFNCPSKEISPALIPYSESINRYDSVFKKIVKYTDFGGLLLINSKSGDVIYTLNKSNDLGVNINEKLLEGTSLARTVNRLRNVSVEEVEIADFEPYFASDNQNKAFIASPMFIDGKNEGVIVLRLPIDSINKIMTFDSNWKNCGLGNSGEVYLVGEDLQLRTESRFFVEDQERFYEKIEANPSLDSILRYNQTSINSVSVKTKACQLALEGKTGEAILTDYMGNEVLSAYAPFKFFGLNWAIITKIDKQEAFENLDFFRYLLIIGFIIVFIIVVIFAFVISGFITRPISELNTSAIEIGKGNYTSLIRIRNKDEIGQLSSSFSTMQNKVLELISSLKRLNSDLDEKQNEIIDSIKYAKKIQDNLLSGEDFFKNNFPSYFIFFNPKDIVSGDFYWSTKIIDPQSSEELLYVAVCDSTGHGIPGAFMSLLNVSYLNEAINIKGLRKPSEILNDVRNSLIESISFGNNKDGMDGVLLCINRSKKTITYAGGFNKPVFIYDNSVSEGNIDRIPIGKSDANLDFNDYQMTYHSTLKIYMYSDGYADQFGGEFNKKFKNKNLINLLYNTSQINMSRQGEEIAAVFNSWKGKNAQIDDVLVVGIEI